VPRQRFGVRAISLAFAEYGLNVVLLDERGNGFAYRFWHRHSFNDRIARFSPALAFSRICGDTCDLARRFADHSAKGNP
jgi:hypothetical protein